MNFCPSLRLPPPPLVYSVILNPVKVSPTPTGSLGQQKAKSFASFSSLKFVYSTHLTSDQSSQCIVVNLKN